MLEVTRVVDWRNRPQGWRAKLGPIDVIRPTKTEARTALLALVEERLAGSFEPAMFDLGDYRVLVYRTLEGWVYRIWSVLNSFSRDGATITCGTADRDAAIRSAKLHLAQIAFPECTGLDLLADDRIALLQHLHWLGFQRAYTFARDGDGLSDVEAHTFACQHADDLRWLNHNEQAIRRAG